MIKLQLLLRHPGPEPDIDEALRAALAAHGLQVTGCGRASVSVQIAADDFARLFGASPDVTSLPVPADLQDAVTLITCPPKHCVLPYPSKGKNAAI
ncbi:MAG TPA: hypothetical protein VFS95_09400 [Telluria sp.]|jgi:hypothetical protein|nr:hypothetical protein [Telluria sp.]